VEGALQPFHQCCPSVSKLCKFNSLIVTLAQALVQAGREGAARLDARLRGNGDTGPLNLCRNDQNFRTNVQRKYRGAAKHNIMTHIALFCKIY
jgi:hypothetical protein